METILNTAKEFRGILGLVSIVSLITFVFSLIWVPVFVCSLPAAYFVSEKQPDNRPRWLRYLLGLGRNLFGILLLVLGFIMLFIPGQGLLTLFLGLAVMEFPGKQHWVNRLAANKKIQKALNWIRKKNGKPPLRFPG